MRLMRKVARRVTLGLAEAKRFAILNEDYTLLQSTNANSQWFLRNVFSPLGQGTASFQIVGNEIVAPFLKLKFSFVVDFGRLRGDNASNYNTVGLTVMLIAANEQHSITAPMSYGNLSGNPHWFYSNDGYRPTMNGNNVKVLKKWNRQITPPVNNTGTMEGARVVNGTLKYRWKKKLTFEDLGPPPTTGGPARASVLRGWNYYILVGTGVFASYTSALSAPPDCYMDSFLYFKDP